jgi:subtilisin family serine protease
VLRIPLHPRSMLAIALATSALLGTACSDSTAPSSAGHSDGEARLAASADGQFVAESDDKQSLATSPVVSADPASRSVGQLGADTIAHIGALGIDGRVQIVPMGARAGDVLPGQFIIVLKEDAKDVSSLARRLTAAHGGRIRQTFPGLKSFSATLSTTAAEALRHDPNVSVIEPNRVGGVEVTQTIPVRNGQAWGLDRIDQAFRPLSGTMTYSHTGLGVYAYIIDSGIRANHPEFGGRALDVATVFGDNGDDCMGHGTHVAGIVGGKTYGVAKQVRLRGVKVVDCTGHGTTEMAIAGINWVYLYHVNPAVANISLGFAKDPALNAAVTRLANSGVFVAVAAGNSTADACQFSPAMASGTFTVAASTFVDGRASFSNWGRCVDAYAPGDQIRSAGLTTYSTVMSGTSMAAPHVAGVAALIKQAYGNVASATLVSTLKSWATPNVITSGAYGATPNRLLYKGGL